MSRNRISEIERIIEIRKMIMARDDIDKTTYAKNLKYTLKAYRMIEERGANATFLFNLFEKYGISSDYILSGIKSPF